MRHKKYNFILIIKIIIWTTIIFSCQFTTSASPNLENYFRKLPEGSNLKIKKIDIKITSFNKDGVNIKIHNGVVKLPERSPIIFNGIVQGNVLDFNIYTQSLNVEEAVKSLGENNFRPPSGQINNIDMYLKGTLSKLNISGKFHIKELFRNNFSAINSPGSLNLTFKNIKDSFSLKGEILFLSGTIWKANAIAVNLEKSKMLFYGNPKIPYFDLKGRSSIEDVKVNITLKGTLKKPELKLTSIPRLSQQELLFMLATGKRWRYANQTLGEGDVPIDVVADFIDYFALGGEGSKIAQAFGLEDISIKYDPKTKIIGIKKGIPEKGEITYSLKPSTRENIPPTHRFGGEYKIVGNIYVGGEKEVKPQLNLLPAETGNREKSESKVILKFKKEF